MFGPLRIAAIKKRLQRHISEQDLVALSAYRSLRSREPDYDTLSFNTLFVSRTFRLIKNLHQKFYESIVQPCEPFENEGKVPHIEKELAIDLIDSDGEDVGKDSEDSEAVDFRRFTSTVSAEDSASGIDSDNDELFGSSGDYGGSTE